MKAGILSLKISLVGSQYGESAEWWLGVAIPPRGGKSWYDGMNGDMSSRSITLSRGKSDSFYWDHVFVSGYNSKKVGSNSNGYGQMLIVQDPNQFLPVAVYNLINAWVAAPLSYIIKKFRV